MLKSSFKPVFAICGSIGRKFSSRAAVVNSQIIFDPYHPLPYDSLFSSHPLKSLRFAKKTTAGLFKNLYASYQIKKKVAGFDDRKFAALSEPLFSRFIEAYSNRDDAVLRKLVTTELADKMKLTTSVASKRGKRRGKQRSNNWNYEGFQVLGFSQPSKVRQLRVLTEVQGAKEIAYGQVTCCFHTRYAPARYKDGVLDSTVPATFEANPTLKLVESAPRWETFYTDKGHQYWYHEGTKEKTWIKPVNWSRESISVSHGPTTLDARNIVHIERNDDPEHPYPEIIHSLQHVVFEIRLLDQNPSFQIAAF
eukprot:g1651.t1